MKINRIYLLFIPFLMTIFSLAGMGWHNSTTNVSIADTNQKIIRTQFLINQINLYEEVMTMSVLMAGVTNDPKWEKRYLESEPHLDKTIAESMLLISKTEDRAHLTLIQSQEKTLDAMDKRAFELIRQGKSREALRIVRSPAYTESKKTYETQVLILEKELTRLADQLNQTAHNDTRISFIIVSGCSLLLLVIWGIVLKTLTSWKRRLDEKTRELAQHASDLKSANGRLRESNYDLENFAAIASHDLQEPLRKIITFGAQLTDDYAAQLDKDGQYYVERMTSSAIRMRSLINDLLSYSRVIRKGSQAESVDLNEVVKNIIQDLELKIREKNATVHVETLANVEADPTQMRQVFQNLISNALKFHRDGIQPVVHIEATMNKPENGLVEIRVSDNGIGFEEKYLDRIFTIFQRLHGRTEYEGSGIGLAICRRIINRHNGTITAKSTPGEGSQFIIRMPLRQNRPLETTDNMTDMIQQVEETRTNVRKSA